MLIVACAVALWQQLERRRKQHVACDNLLQCDRKIREIRVDPPPTKCTG